MKIHFHNLRTMRAQAMLTLANEKDNGKVLLYIIFE